MEKKTIICLDAAGIKRLQSEEMGKAILKTATVDNLPRLLEEMGLYQLRVSDEAIAQLVKMFKYSVMIRMRDVDDDALLSVSDSPTLKRSLLMDNERWWVVDNRTGETVVTID